MSELRRDTIGMRAVFWSWTVIIFGGLAFMIAIGLVGR